mmetsp:Transcript_7444/g.11238  ORF Transcript_7444/g.11238 Transcript_7444/m.11238 type:complete len:131 (+) Transcript_7444:2192-2584(+)
MSPSSCSSVSSLESDSPEWAVYSWWYSPPASCMSSSWDPMADTDPSLITAILSASRIVLSLWAMMTVVLFCCFLRLSRAFWTRTSLSLSSALVASSRSRILGSRTRALAIAILCFCPPDICRPPSPTSVS